MATKFNSFAVSSKTIYPPQWEYEEPPSSSIYPNAVFFPLNFMGNSEIFTDSKDVFNGIYRLIQEHMGLDISIYKPEIIQGHIRRRMLIYKFGRVAEYMEYMGKHPDEIHALYQDILIKVTSFFRDREFFDGLTNELFPKMLQGRQSNQPIRIWVAGCATGEEVYSIAICLKEYLEKNQRNIPFQLFASDIDTSALTRAHTGIFSEARVGAIATAGWERYFERVSEGYKIVNSIRDACHFIHHDVVEMPPVSGMDLISCRNLLIYLDQNIQQQVISQFHGALNSPGYIALGASETIGERADLFRLLGKQGKVYEKKCSSLISPTLNDNHVMYL